MSEVPDRINRRSIDASNWETAFWLPRYLEIANGPYTTEANQANYRDDTKLTALDHAMLYLYIDLSEASEDRLIIPAGLEVDQIEDWFISRAIAKGVQLQMAINK